MLRRQIWDLFLEELEKPLGSVAVVVAEEHGVDKIAGLDGVTEGASWAVGVGKDSA